MTEITKFILLIEIVLLSFGGLKAENTDDGVYYYDTDQGENSADNTFQIDDVHIVPLQMVRRNDFFLKASKSVPRIGRRNDFFYAKTHKSVPRIGRRNDFFLKASKSVPRIGRRNDLTSPSDKEAMVAWPWFRDHDFIPRVLKKDTSSLDDKNKEIPESRQQPLV